MTRARSSAPSVLRKFTLWFFKYPPFSPYVTANIVIDFEPALEYLRGLGSEPKVTINDLMMAAVGRLYTEFPEANRRVIGNKIFEMERVCVAAPVDLLDAPAAKQELALAMIEDVDTRSLLQIAEKSKRTVSSERKGKPAHPLLKALLPLGERAPDFAFRGALSAVDRLGRSSLFAPMMHRLVPISCVLSNPGAVFKDFEGGRFLGASMSPPARLAPVGSIMGLSAVQDEVMAIGGKPVVRKGLPLAYVFDHRLFDGVMCSRILRRLAELLLEPAKVFGTDGKAVG